MYVILYVISMLMLLASLTYARIESYRSSKLSQAQFEHYMQEEERTYINAQATKLYHNTVVSSKDKEEKQKRASDEATARISFYPLIDPDISKRYPASFEKFLQLAISLIDFLYKDKKFYREKVEEDPQIVRQLLEEIHDVATDPKKTVKKLFIENPGPKTLASIEIENQTLSELLKAMFEEDTKEMRQEANQSPTYNIEDGHLSLLDFITMKNNKPKIRLFLASPMVLMALFNDPNAVRAIISSREEVYKDYAVRDRYEQDEATETFRNAVFRHAYGFDDTLMDFSVSKTNPKNYWISN